MSFKAPILLYTNNCFKCNSNFVFWKGKFRHHCRCCGNNFCNDCLPNYCAFPHIGITKEVRNCDTCYEKYKVESEEDNDIFYDFELENEVSSNSDEDFEENAQYLPINEAINVSGINEALTSRTSTDDAADDPELTIALSLSRIEDKFIKYTTSSDTAIMSEEEEIEFVLRLSALEDKAKKIASRKLETPNSSSTNMSEDEELKLALAISVIENEDKQTSKQETEPSNDAAPTRQVHCPICFEERLEYALVRCGHVVCGDCKPKLEECPICRAEIRDTIRVYITD